MRKVFLKIIKNSWISILLLFFITLILGSQIKNISSENRFTTWLPEKDEVMRLFLDTGEKFGSNEMVLITIKAKEGETFRQEVLKALKTACEELKTKKEIFTVTSIIHAPYIQVSEDGLIISDFIEEVPEDPSFVELKKKEALSKESYLNTFISSDAQWLGVAVYLQSGVDTSKTFEEIVSSTMRKHLSRLAEVHFSGEPCFTYYADKYLRRDLFLLVPLIVVTILIVLYLNFRRLRAILLPSSVVWISSIWVFGLMAIFKIPMNLMTPALPVLLVALGSAYGIHVVNSLEQSENFGAGRELMVYHATARIFLPVILAAGTTMAGFASFLTARLKIIMEFGLFAMAGIFAAMFLSLSLIPFSCYLIPEKKKKTRINVSLISSRALYFLYRKVSSHPGVIIISCIVLFLFFISWIPRIKREVNFTSYFPENSEPQISDSIVRKYFDGASPLTLYFKTENVKTAGALRVLRRAENFMTSLPECGLPFSVVELIRELNEKMNDRFALPVTEGQVENLWLFLEGRDELRQIISEDFREALVFSRTSSANTNFQWKLRKRIEEFLLNEMNTSYSEIRLSSLPEKERQTLRKKEASYLIEEMSWLLERYAPKFRFNKEKARERLLRVIDKWPEVSDREVIARAEKEINSFLYSSSFDFEMSLMAKEKLASRIKQFLNSGWFEEKNLIEIISSSIPEGIYDERIGEEVSTTIILRINEALERVFVERASAALREFFPLEVRENPNFQKRLRGLFFEIADDLAVLPKKIVAEFTGIIEDEERRITFEFIGQSGLPPVLTQLDHFLFVSQIQSFALALALIFLIMLFLRRSFILAIISLTPVVFTLGIIYGYFGLAGIPLDYVTMMVASVSIGVGIDYSIHFLHAFNKGLKEGLLKGEAIELAYRNKGRAIVANSVAVMSGFAVLLFSSMSPLRYFGGIMVGSMFLAAFSALTFLPALLLKSRI